MKTTLRILGVALMVTGLTVAGFALWQNGGANDISVKEQVANAQVLSPVIQGENADTVGNGVGESGEPFARMYVPSWGKDYVRPIYQGTNLSILDKGIGHYVNTSLPEEAGNFAVAAHRTTVGANFYKIDELKTGDKIYVETNDTLYEYTFVNHIIIKPTETDVLNPVPYGFNADAAPKEALNPLHILTMTSCNPIYSDKERIIAYSVMTASYKSGEVPESVKANIDLVK